jgi:hypothetical protein
MCCLPKKKTISKDRESSRRSSAQLIVTFFLLHGPADLFSGLASSGNGLLAFYMIATVCFYCNRNFGQNNFQ